MVLKRTYGTSKVGSNTLTDAPHDTYYVYDNYGNLTYVLPPKMEASTATMATINGQLNELGYQYKYDNRNRLVEKRIPGKDWEYIVYDNLDRPVLTQDSYLRITSPDQWLFTKYDALGRVVYTGIYRTNSLRNTLQTQFNSKNAAASNYEIRVASGSGFGSTYYTNSDYPTSISTNDILTVNYYDDYGFDLAGSFNPTTNNTQVYGKLVSIKTTGLVTGSKVRVLNTTDWITTVSYYDEKNRPVYVYAKNNYLKTTDIVKSKLDFVGKVDETTSLHTKTDSSLPTIVSVDDFEYDHVGRLKKQTQTIGGNTEVIAVNTYDALGQLEQKEVGGKNNQARLQTIAYKYNIRGWLKQINNPTSLGNSLFAFKINYNTVNHSGTKLYNGNISETEWRTNNSDDSSLHWYKFQYDALNRITSATDNLNRYTVNNISYDKNGNLMTLKRLGHIVAQPNKNYSNHFGVMDNLAYTYNSTSNKLKNVQEASGGHSNYGFKNGSTVATEYTYDANGNMKTDTNKGITNINYNHLNLPTQVTVNGQNILYVYDAIGSKLQKTVGSTTTDYAGNYVYENGNLQFFNTAEGYASPINAANYSVGYNYVYQYKDHLGNIRLSYSDSDNNGSISQSEIIEENNYYPFGLQHKGYNSNVSPNGNSTAQKFKYNGKELNESLGLNLYEMDLRQYDPAIARWTGIDPITHHSMSTYTAFDNNPIYWADPSGGDSWTYVSGRTYRNSQTGEETEDWQRAINETQAHFGDGTDDDKRVDSKTGKTTITKTNDSQDRLFVDGKFVKTAEQGSFEKELIENGTEFTYRSQPKAVGMGVTDAALSYFSGEVILDKLFKGSVWLYRLYRGRKAKQAIETIKTLNPYKLEMTHGLTLSKRQFQLLKDDIAKNGIKEAIQFVEHNGVKYVVGGHHRLRIAKELGLKNVPIQQVSLPFAGYKTTADLIFTKY